MSEIKLEDMADLIESLDLAHLNFDEKVNEYRMEILELISPEVSSDPDFVRLIRGCHVDCSYSVDGIIGMVYQTDNNSNKMIFAFKFPWNLVDEFFQITKRETVH